MASLGNDSGSDNESDNESDNYWSYESDNEDEEEVDESDNEDEEIEKLKGAEETKDRRITELEQEVEKRKGAEETLEGRNTELEGRNTELEGKLKGAEEKITVLKKQKRGMSDDHKRFDTQIRDAANQIHNTYNEKIKELEKDHEKVLGERDRRITELEGEKSELNDKLKKLEELEKEIEELKQIKYKYEELTKDTSAATGGGSSIGQDEHGQKRKATSSDEVDPQKKTKTEVLAEDLPDDAKATFGPNNTCPHKEGNVSISSPAVHTIGKRYALSYHVEGKKPQTGQYFLHKTATEGWKIMGLDSSKTLMKKQKTSGEWEEL